MKGLPVLAVLVLTIAGPAAQDWQISRTEWGDPDLEGIWVSANADGLPRRSNIA